MPRRAAELKGIFFQESHQDFEWPAVPYTDVDSAWGGGENRPRSHGPAMKNWGPERRLRLPTPHLAGGQQHGLTSCLDPGVSLN